MGGQCGLSQNYTNNSTIWLQHILPDWQMQQSQLALRYSTHILRHQNRLQAWLPRLFRRTRGDCLSPQCYRCNATIVYIQSLTYLLFLISDWLGFLHSKRISIQTAFKEIRWYEHSKEVRHPYTVAQILYRLKNLKAMTPTNELTSTFLQRPPDSWQEIYTILYTVLLNSVI